MGTKKQSAYIETFDVFENDDYDDDDDRGGNVEEEKKGGESDPWSASTWGDITTAVNAKDTPSIKTPTKSGETMTDFLFPVNTGTNNDDVESSFDSHAAFQFSAEALPPEFGYNPFVSRKNGTNSHTQQPSEQELFPPDPMANVSGDDSMLLLASSTNREPSVRVTIREQFSTIYDDAGCLPSCHLEGTVFVQPSSLPLNASNNDGPSFCVVIKDSHGYIDQIDAVHSVSANISTTSDTEAGNTVVWVSLPTTHVLLQEVPIATYTCNPQLKPIPMLIKSRVQVTDDLSRVGFKIRANPSNTEPLQNMVILVAVPPFVQGDTVKMSRKGGVWDEMKRTICWTVEQLEPGEVLEIQAQFQSGNLQNLAQVNLQFPVLVRADVPRLFSAVNIATYYHHDHKGNGGDAAAEGAEGETIVQKHIQHTLSQSTRILHRKV